MGRLRVISAEGLISCKLEAITNDSTRTRALDDIRALIHRHRPSLDTAEWREYFALFDKMDLFHELIT